MSNNYSEKPQIKLPFEGDKFSLSEWVYTHRVGLCITLIVYLLMAIAFLTAKITLDKTPHTKGIMIDLQQLAELERKRDELKKSVEELHKERDLSNDWKSVQNRASNENALDERVKDDRNTDVDKLLKDAAEFQQKMAANREAYESGVAEAEAIKDRPTTQNDNESKNIHKDSNIKGNVTVSYSLNNPVRHAQRLVVPAYLCEGGGEVIVNITVNRSGEVTNAKVASGGDSCMQESALSSARASKFDLNTSAPQQHNGTITYIFIPQ